MLKINFEIIATGKHPSVNNAVEIYFFSTSWPVYIKYDPITTIATKYINKYFSTYGGVEDLNVYFGNNKSFFLIYNNY